MTIPFEDLPLARDTPIGDGRILWEASFLADRPDGTAGSATVRVLLRQDKASELRLKQERRGNLMCGMLVDAGGMVYGISSVYVGLSDTGDQPVCVSLEAKRKVVDALMDSRHWTGAWGMDCGDVVEDLAQDLIDAGVIRSDL